MKYFAFVIPSALIIGTFLIFSSCNTQQNSRPGSKAGLWERELGAVANVPLNPADAQKNLNLKVDLIPDGKYGRRLFREMKPQYITIHSTQNPTGDAYAHAKALKRGALRGGVCGYLCWHFTVQGDAVIQHIPTSERGEHADFDGPGNRYSIGIEMCEHAGNNQLATMERTAKLAASLMYFHKIPIENIRAHYHWPREGYSTPNKDCPHFLLENGRPGETWRWFVGRINQHHTRLAKFDEAVRQQKEKEAESQRRKQMVQRVWQSVSELFGLS